MTGASTLLNSTSCDNYTFALLPQPNNSPLSVTAKECWAPHTIYFILGKSVISYAFLILFSKKGGEGILSEASTPHYP